MPTKQFAAGMRWTDIEDVREVLTGWDLEWTGQASQRLLTARGPEGAWVIQRLEGNVFIAFRLRLEANVVYPEGRPVFDENNQLRMLRSARRAAEVIALLYRTEEPGQSASTADALISPEQIERLLREIRRERTRRPGRARLGRRL